MTPRRDRMAELERQLEAAINSTGIEHANAQRIAAAARRRDDVLAIIDRMPARVRESPKLIAQSLNAKRIKAPRGGTWEGSQVSALLKRRPVIAIVPTVTQTATDTLIVGDCIDEMRNMQTGRVDVVITSPPYNLSESSGRGANWPANSRWQKPRLAQGYNSHHDSMPHDAYVKWQHAVLRECWRVINDAGAIYYNHKPRIRDGALWTPLELIPPDITLRQIIIWARDGGINFSTNHYLSTSEWIMLLAKPDFKLRNQSASGIGDVWRITQELDSAHPAPFPIELPRRILRSINARAVLDPFSGSGTTGVACAELGIDYIGIDNAANYMEMARKRIAEARRR